MAGILFLQPGGAQNKPTLEYQVKASYLYNFLQFVRWPVVDSSGAAAPETSDHLIVGILGKDRFGVALDSLQGKLVREKEIMVERLKSVKEAENCQVLFISSSERRQQRRMIAALKGRSILTIGESKKFAESGGMINFVLMRDKIRFEINLGAAREAGIEISSQLLRLAVTVYGKEN